LFAANNKPTKHLLLSKQLKSINCHQNSFCLPPKANQQHICCYQSNTNKAIAIKIVFFAANSKPTKYLLLPKQH
jgi:hypothetical protein